MNIMETFRKGMDRDVNEFLPFLPLLPVLNLGAGKKLIDGTMPLDIDRGWKAPGLPYGNEERWRSRRVSFHGTSRER
jgi:hypothetical protein